MNNGNDIDKLVYDLMFKYVDKGLRPYLYRYECFELIENIKIPKDDILLMIKDQMGKHGFTDRTILFASELSRRLRFNRRDSREIIQRLQEKGMINIKRNNVYLCNGND